LQQLFEVDFLPSVDNKRKAEDASFTIRTKEKEEMLTLSQRIRQVVRHVEPVVSERVWEWAKVLVIGALLAPGERTVTAIVRVMGCADDQHVQNDHRVLTRATWSNRERSRRLLVRLCIAGNEPVIMGIDDTIERRRGRTMATRGVSRDPVRSRCAHPWAALDVAAAADPHSMGLPCLGLALCDRVGSRGAHSRGAEEAAHNAHGVGLAEDPARCSLDAWSTLEHRR